MNETKIENAVRSLYFKGKIEDYGDINAWDFLTEFTKNVLEELGSVEGKGQMNMDEELKPMPSGLAENQAAQAEMLLGLLKRVHALEELVGMDHEKEAWGSEYDSARDELARLNERRSVLGERIDALYRQGLDAGYGVPVDAGAHE